MKIIDIGYREREWQAGVASKLKRFSVLVIHGRAGKTVLAIMHILNQALRLPRRDGQYAYIAPELKIAKRNAWSYLKLYATRIPGTIVHEAELSVILPNGARIWLLGADNPDALRGIYLDGAVLDEVAQMKPETWGEIVSMRLLDRHGWALFIGTPKGINLLSELYFDKQKDPEWYTGLFTWRETCVFTEAQIEEQRKLMTPSQFRQELECDFSAAAENQIIPFDLVNAALGKHLRDEAYNFAPKILGVDVAFKEAGDRSVIWPRQGLASFTPDVYRGVDNMELADLVARKATTWDADAIMIDGGRGEGVISRLERLGFKPMTVNFGGSASSPFYANKRIEIFIAVREWLESGGVLPPTPTEIRQDFCAVSYSRTRSTDKMQAESNDDLKSRGLPSPDLLCALACTFAYPVLPRTGPLSFHGAKPQMSETRYDPHARNR